MSNYLNKLLKFREGFNAPTFLLLEESAVYKRKIQVVKDNIASLLVMDWVRFVGITGSVAAGTAQDKDDIDVMVVVKNDRVWLYRLILFIRAFFNDNLIQFSDSAKGTVKDKIEVNFIIEERALKFEEELFSLHELLCMIPLYNDEYFYTILGCNRGLLTRFGLRVTDQSISIESKRFFFLRLINKLAFYLQYLYSMRNGKNKKSKEAFKRWGRRGRVAIWELYSKR
jgi:hypothetical protein